MIQRLKPENGDLYGWQDFNRWADQLCLDTARDSRNGWGRWWECWVEARRTVKPTKEGRELRW